MFNGNLLKWGYTNVQDSETRVIDSNELVARRLEQLEQKKHQAEEARIAEETAALANAEADGFEPGLHAERVDSALILQAKEDAEIIVRQAREQAEGECARMRAEMMTALQQEREDTLASAREEGYAEGLRQAERELEIERGRLNEQLKQREREFQEILDNLEPQFIDTITGIYEHIFHVDLESYREVLVYLISSTLRSVEGTRDFLVHVSKEDYPYVSMQKKEILAGAASPNSTVEFVEDITLGKNECLIETDSGIFDCGLGTQLEELGKRLRLLSYER